MSLTKEELTQLTDKIKDRLAEFENLAEYMPKLSVGVVRIAYEEIMQWQEAESYQERMRLYQVGPDGTTETSWQRGYEEGYQEAERTRDYADAIAAEPEPEPAYTNGNGHHVERVALPDPDVARGKLAAGLANGSGGALVAPTLGERAKMEAEELKARAAEKHVLPDLPMLVKELQRQAMGGVAPSMTAFDMAKPANWAKAQAQVLRLGMSWAELAQEAGLKPKRGGA